jgi:hypothetical protein
MDSWELLGLNLAGTPIILTEVSCDFPQSFQADDEILPQLGHDHFLPSPFQLISCATIRHCMV